jgi:hypothetical protein
MDFKNCIQHKSGGVQVGGRYTPPVPFREPRTTDGIDYVLNPGERVQESASILPSWLPGVKKIAATSATATAADPFTLLNHRIPVRTIMEKNGIGLDHMLRAGVTMYDFLKNGYTWQDICQFEEMSKGATRALQVVTTGLKTNANLFRLYPDALPFAQVKQHTKLEARHVCELFGLTFPDDGPLMCQGDQRWNALDCVNLGLTMDNLQDFGLYYRQQYEDLMLGLTAEEQVEAEKRLKATVKHVDALVDANEQLSFPQEKTHTTTIIQQQQRVESESKRIGPEYVKREEEEEQEEEEVEVRPLSAPIRRYNVAAAAAVAPKPAILTVSAVAPAPSVARKPYEKRFDRHGYVLKR